MTQTVLITRALDDAEDFAADVSTLGYRSVVEPLFDIEPCPVDLTGVTPDALVVTSARALPDVFKSVPLFVMGDSSAQKAMALGFQNVQSSEGEFPALLQAVRNKVPAGGLVLYLRGDVTRHDLAENLPDYIVQELIVYRTTARTHLSEETVDAMRSGGIDVVTLFSPRTAHIFHDLIVGAGLKDALKSINLLSLSDAVLESVKLLPWKTIRIAARPDRAGMLSILQNETFDDGRDARPHDR